MFIFIYFFGSVFFLCFFEELDVLLGVASFGLCKFPFFSEINRVFFFGGGVCLSSCLGLGVSAWCVSVMVCEF